MPKPTHFLIVDDDPIFAAVAEGLLRTLGARTVAVAGDGEAGLRLLDAASPPVDIVILDLNMPRLDGLAYLRKLAERGFRGNVLLSTGESQAIREAAERMGRMLGVDVCGALVKPLRREELAAELDLCAARAEAPERRSGAPVSLAEAESGRVVPYYQPQVDILQGDVVGLETLARLQMEDGRILGPNAVFHPEMPPERLPELTLTIAAAAMADAARWRDLGVQRRVSINLDSRVIEVDGVLPRLVELAREQDLEPDSIVFELTETALPSSMTNLVEALTRLRMMGFGLSIDDYGTGTANFSLLRLCPFSELKIDRSIIVAAVSDTVTRRFMDGLVAMAADLAMDVVAEGVETPEQLAMVRGAGIAVVQGFIFARPMPADAAFAWSPDRASEARRAGTR